MMEKLLQDLRYATGQLLRQPGFTFIAVVTLALGIGANTAMFSIIDATMIEPLPYTDPDRLVRVREVTPEGMNFTASDPNYLDFRDQSSKLDALAAFKDRAVSLTGQGEPVRLDGLAITHNFFDVLGVRPLHGRNLIAEEDAVGGDNAAVMLSYRLWQTQFGADAGIVGKTVVLDDRAHRVVGVLPPDFRFFDTAFFTPLAPDPDGDRGDHWLGMIGRLAPGVSLSEAEAELRTIATRIGEKYPAVAGWSVRMTSLSNWLVGEQFRLSAWLLFGAVGFLLLMACVNLANLLFVRAQRRQGEIGIRTAIGASRFRIVRQLLTEALLLSLLGVVLGLVVAWFAVTALQAMAPGDLPRAHEIDIDGGVLVFTLLLGVVTAAIFGVLPALRATRVDLNEVLQQGSRGQGSPSQQRMRDVLVVVQFGLATLLLVGAGLLLRSFWQLQNADPGFDPSNVLAVQLQLADERYPEAAQKVAFFRQLEERIEGLPGVISAGATAIDPFSGGGFMNGVTPVEHAAETGRADYARVAWRAVTPGFFDTLDIPLLNGRVFTDANPAASREVVITRRMAEQLWPGESAVGRRFYWGSTGGTPMTVMGVVGNYQDVERGGGEAAVMFIAHEQLAWGQMTLLVGTRGNIDGIAALVRNEIAMIDPALPVPAIVPLQSKLSSAVAGPRFRTLLLGAFALAALLLAAIGIYGVMAFNITRRTREMGLRLAMGAQPGRLLIMVLGKGARLVLAGAVLGVVAAFAMTQVLNDLLYRTESGDPWAMALALTLLAAAALIACWLPARRAARVEPVQALRQD